jgi:hypothetical protein
MRRLVLIFWWCWAGMAQTTQPADANSLARVEGRVMNSATGEPLRKAEVLVHGGAGGEYSATTDAAGHFAVERIAPGNYTITIQHQNFAPVNYGATRPGMLGTPVALAAGQSLSAIEVKLTPFGVISGKVVDEDGDPVSGVLITVMRWGYLRGARQLVNAGSGGSTDDRGQFRIHNLATGRYYLVAHPVGSAYYRRSPSTVTKDPVRETYTPTFYPSSPDASSAASVLVSAGQEVPGMDIQLRKSRVYSVQGRVNGAERGHRYSVMLIPKDSTGGMSSGISRSAVVRAEDSTFIVHGVSPGLYSLLVMANGRVSTRQEVSVGDNDIEGLTVPLAEPATIKGRIQMAASATGKTASVKGLRVMLQSADGMMNSPMAEAAEDGSFVMEQVAADRYNLSCLGGDGTYLKTIRWNGQVLNDAAIEVAGGGSATLDLAFEATTAALDGDVKTSGDQPAPGVHVLLVPDSRREMDFRLMLADQNGHFSAKGIAPGAYTALAVDTPMGGMPDPALLKALEKDTTAVTVDENGHATVSLKVIPQAALDAVQ